MSFTNLSLGTRVRVNGSACPTGTPTCFLSIITGVPKNNSEIGYYILAVATSGWAAEAHRMNDYDVIKSFKPGNLESTYWWINNTDINSVIG